MRGVTSSTNATSEKRLFQPALPMRGVTRPQLLGTVNIVISTRTPHAGSDAALTFLWVVSPFQPALPMRGVTHHGRYRRGRHRFQPALPMRGVTQDNLRNALYTGISTRTPHAGSDFVPVGIEITNEISTRTPHAGSDSRLRRIAHALLISTRTPHAGSDVDDLSHISEHCQFQPALPMRGVTITMRRSNSIGRISTRTPHAGSDRTVRRFHLHGTISTRTPHAGSDLRSRRKGCRTSYFNPHSPCGE